MAARAAAGRDAAACFGRSVVVASVRAMVKQGGSETAENDGSKLLNVTQPRLHLSLPGRCCYLACRSRHPDTPPSRDDGDKSVFKRNQKHVCGFVPQISGNGSKSASFCYELWGPFKTRFL
jgi:hypothetical protein